MSLANIENFDISQTLPVIACDYESLKTWALAYVSRYKDLVITEDQVRDIKKDMAEINKAKQNLERARIDAVKAVSAPIKDFEAKIKDVVCIFDNAYKSLGDQVKGFEMAAREAKRAEIQAAIDRQIADFVGKHQDMEGKIAILVPDKWLNKTCHMKDIGNEIDRLIREQYAEDQERQRIERAQAERRILIENLVKAANEKYGVNMCVSGFMVEPFVNLDFAASLLMQDINQKASFEFAKKEQELAQCKPLPVPPFVCDVIDMRINDIPLQPAQEQPQHLIMFRLTALFTPEQEDKVREILNQNHFMKIVRQLQGIGADVKFEKVNANELK